MQSSRDDRIVGRARELAAIAGSFAEGARLVTIVGPAGIGKTTLAAGHAAQRAGAIVVELGEAATEAELVDRVTEACGAAGDVVTALDALGSVVLVLDGFDALVASASALVVSWLERCVELDVVVTTRERLAVSAEHVLELGPIGDVEEGIAILTRAARKAQIGYVPSPDDLAALAQLVGLLEGIPLALELAGVRLGTFGARALVAELAAGASHGSTEAALKHSFDALDPTEQDVLAGLTPFRGGFTAESVRGVLGDAAFDVALRLGARSLVRVRAPGRLDLYGAVASLALRERPRAAGAAASRHVAWFSAEADRIAERVHVDPSARTWLVAERENLLAVARTVLGDATPGVDAAEPALRAILAARHVLVAGGPRAELIELVAPVVERTRDSGADPRLSSRALAMRGGIRRDRGDVRGALKDLLSAESVARALADPVLEAEIAVELGRTLRRASELEPARQTFDRAARLFGSAGAHAGEAEATALSGATSAELGDREIALVLCQRAVALGGNDLVVGPRLHLLVARAHAETDDLGTARRSADEAHRRAASGDDLALAGEALVLLGLVVHLGGDLEEATRVFARARDRFLVRGLALEAAIAEGHLGAIAREQGNAAGAYASLAAARATTMLAEWPAHAAYFGAHLAAIEESVGRTDAARELLEASTDARDPDPWWPISFGAARSLHGRLLARCRERGAAARERLPPEDALVVGAGGAWFRPPHGTRVGLERRRSLALVLDRLAQVHVERAPTVTTALLFASGWPGEKALASAAAHRVRVAIATLRKLGLRDDVATTLDGYRLREEVVVVRA